MACFGLGRLLGSGNTANIGDDPFEMESIQTVDLGGRKAVQVTVGQQHSCAVLADQTAVCWGEGEWGVLGYNSEDQVIAPGNRTVRLQFKVKQIEAYASHTCALSWSGFVSCFGSKKNGRVGWLSVPDNDISGRACIGCGVGEMRLLPRLTFGCAKLTRSGVCPALLERNNQCEICKRSWSQSQCNRFSPRCRWRPREGKDGMCRPA